MMSALTAYQPFRDVSPLQDEDGFTIHVELPGMKAAESKPRRIQVSSG